MKYSGIDRNADAEAIKSAYRKLAKKVSPDLHPGDTDAGSTSKEVNEAYSVLSDPDRRQSTISSARQRLIRRRAPAADTAAALPIWGSW